MWYLWFFVLEAVFIVTGNVTVLVAFTRTPALRKRKHFLLVSLAVADFLVGVVSVPMFVTLFVWRPEILNVIYKIQDALFGTASVFGLTAVAIERAYAVYFPFKHRTLWKGVYVIGIAVIWIVAAFMTFSSRHFDGLLWICVVTVPILVSLVVIIISYSLIWIKMNCMTSVQGHAIHERDHRLTVTLLIITVISLIAWIPFQVLMVYDKTCRRCVAGKVILLPTHTAKFLHYGNSLVNPIIYALRMPQFQNALLCRLRRCVACNKINYEADRGNRPNTNRTTGSVNDSHHDNGLGNPGNNGNELELNTIG